MIPIQANYRRDPDDKPEKVTVVNILIDNDNMARGNYRIFFIRKNGTLDVEHTPETFTNCHPALPNLRI